MTCGIFTLLSGEISRGLERNEDEEGLYMEERSVPCSDNCDSDRYADSQSGGHGGAFDSELRLSLESEGGAPCFPR
jgi:hypothetical protein